MAAMTAPLHHAPFGEERFALLYSDGGIGILTAGLTLEGARRERAFVDDKDPEPRHWTKIVRLTIPAYEVVEDPTMAPPLVPAPPIEVEALRARVAELEAQLQQKERRRPLVPPPGESA